MADASWCRPDGAQLVLIDRRLSMRRTATAPWEPVRIIEGTRRGRLHAARLWAHANGFTPARDQATGPTAVTSLTTPQGETVRVVVMPLGGQPRIPLDVACEGGRWWARRQSDRGWSSDEHCGTAIGRAIGMDPDHRVVLAAAVRAMKRLDRMPQRDVA